MAKIIDLDALVGADKQVRIGGEVYRLPADIPVELYLRILHFADGGEEGDETETVQQMRDAILELFHLRQPKLAALPGGIGLELLVRLIGEVYGDSAETDPTRPPRRGAGTKKRTPKPKTTQKRPRSSTS